MAAPKKATKKAAKKITRKVRKTILPAPGPAPASVIPPVVEASVVTPAQKLIAEMVAGGAAKLKISEALGVSNQTILSIASGTTRSFRKMAELQKLYQQWQAGKVVLKGQRGRKVGAVAKKAAVKPAVKPAAKPADKAMSFGDALPQYTEKMLADIEKQIEDLKQHALYMKDVIALKKKYGK